MKKKLEERKAKLKADLQQLKSRRKALKDPIKKLQHELKDLKDSKPSSPTDDEENSIEAQPSTREASHTPRTTSLHEWSAAMYTNDTKVEIITRIDVATRVIREITTAFATNDDLSPEALKSYNAAMEEHLAALADVQQIMDKIISDIDTPPST